MLIPKINSIPSFKGIFTIVQKSGASDNVNAIETNNTKAVYHPYKHETNTETEKAMRDYRNKSTAEVIKRYCGRNPKTGRAMYRLWSVSDFYTCTLGAKLPYDGTGVIDPDLE